MVGIPGSSRGCITCRRRKKGCDLGQPTCLRCRKAGIQCHGYDRAKAPAGGTEASLARGRFAKATDGGFHSPSPTSSFRLLPMAGTTMYSKPSSSSNITLHPSLTRSAYESRCLSLFWENYVPTNHLPGIDPPGHFSTAGWIPAVQQLHHSDPALHNALLALCVGSLGRAEKQAWMCQDSARFYIMALSEMKAGLRHTGRRISDALLLASMLLSTYELLYGLDDSTNTSHLPWATSWFGHNSGRMNMILLREPGAYVDGHSHSLFVDGRISAAIAFIVSRKRNPLDGMQWKTSPWEKHPKTSLDIVIDALIAIAGLLEDYDTLRLHTTQPNDPSRHRVIDDCRKINQELAFWHQSPSPSPQANLHTNNDQTTPNIEDLDTVSLQNLRWTAFLLTSSTLQLAAGLLLDSSTSDQHPLAGHTDPRSYCKLIINSTVRFLINSSGTDPTHSLVFPLGMAFTYLQATETGAPSAELRQVMDFFNASDKGMKIRRFLNTMLFSGPASVIDLQDRVEEGGMDEWRFFKAKARAWFGLAPDDNTVPHW